MVQRGGISSQPTSSSASYAALQSADRGSVRPVGPAVRPVCGVEAPTRARRGGGDGVSDASGGGAAGECEYAESGALGHYVPVSRGVGRAGGVVERAGAGQAAGAGAGGVDTG